MDFIFVFHPNSVLDLLFMLHTLIKYKIALLWFLMAGVGWYNIFSFVTFQDIKCANKITIVAKPAECP